ncbi:MAG: redox-sensing transcriptional repressor Rex [Bacteroidales bacterium]|nr:redox-sensing transcriptional repressor Rex [Bacteroidales bacterium]
MSLVRSDIGRLLQYKLCLLRFKELGVNTIFSYNLGEAAGVTAVQVRKDFSVYGIKGRKRGGYNIDTLLIELNNIFGNSRKNIVVVGIGNIGKAIIQYNERFVKKNLHIVAGFDIDPSKQNKSYGVPIYPVEKISEVIKNNNVSTAIIAVPFQVAQELCNILISAGIKGILNFAPIILKVPDEIIVDNINLSNKLEGIIYNINL